MSPTTLLNIFTQTDSAPLAVTPAPITNTISINIPLPPHIQPKVLYPQLDGSQSIADIRTYAPDWGPVQESTKILICVHGFSFFDQYLFPSVPPSTSPFQSKAGAKSRKKSANSSPMPNNIGGVNTINNNVYYYSFWCVFDFGMEVPATVRSLEIN